MAKSVKRKPSAETRGQCVERRSLDSLKTNPLQARFFKDLDQEKLRALADDIRRRGLKDKIVILPDGTILDGHQRAKALEMNGEADAEVVVRHDLAKAKAPELEQEFLSFNVRRRQLSPFALTRAELTTEAEARAYIA